MDDWAQGEGRDVVVASAPMIGKRVLLDAAIWRGFVDGHARLSSALPEIYVYCTTVLFLNSCRILFNLHLIWPMPEQKGDY